jgi:putative oxidoreductase
MGVLFGESMRGTAGYAPLVVRVLAGLIMTAHGWQKLTEFGPANFGNQVLGALGVPLPEAMGFVVTFVELVGGILLIVELLSRLAALLLTIDLVVAILLVKVNIGLLSGSNGTGAELELALIAGFLVVLLAGPGKLSVDHSLGYEGDLVEEAPTRRRSSSGRSRRSSSRSGWRRRLPF